MIDLLQKLGRISIADKECYVNQTKNKSGEFSGERLAFGTSYSPSLALRLFLGAGMKNKEHKKEYMEKWYQENKEYYREYHKDWRQKNKEKCKKYAKEWDKKNEEKRKKHFFDNPWLITKKGIMNRCNSKNGSYRKRNIKNYLTAENLKVLWFRDKAYLMKNPSIDRIKKGNYSFENCRYIELLENQKRKKFKYA